MGQMPTTPSMLMRRDPVRTSFRQGRQYRNLLGMAESAGVMARELIADHGTGVAVAKYSQDVEPFIDRAKELQWDASFDGYTPSKDLKLVATIPNVVAMKWCTEEGIQAWKEEDWPRVQNKLNDSEYLYLRLGQGTI